jgi:hypothetical protein
LTCDHRPRPAAPRSRLVRAYATGGLAAAALGAWGIAPPAGASGAKAPPVMAPCSGMSTSPSTDGELSGPLRLSASTSKLGCVGLSIQGAAGSPVSITEVIPGAAPATPIAVLTPLSGEAVLGNGVVWLCDRLTRTFQATEVLADGTAQTTSTSVATPSCATRLSATVPPTRVHRGYPLTLALTDRWGLGGLRVRACVGPSRRQSCRAVTLRSGHSPTLLRLTPSSAGAVALDASDPFQKVRLGLHVHSSRPLLLATGDSEMQVLDDDIASDLSGSNGARVISDARQSTAISSPFFFNWPAHAVGQAEGKHPDIVAMFLGGNEGFRLDGAECCGSDWSRAYAARVAGMMRAYRQGGAATVYWFLIPTPSREPFVKVARAVNRGIVSAAAQFREGVHFFDLRPTFSPGGRYINSLTHDGRTITVHESDGFHLSESADPIVARMFIERLRRDGVLP